MCECSADGRIRVKPLDAQDEKPCEWDSITGLSLIPGCRGLARYAVSHWCCGGHFCGQHGHLEAQRFGPSEELVPLAEGETWVCESCAAPAVYARTGAFADFTLCPAHTLQWQLGIAHPVGAATP